MQVILKVTNAFKFVKLMLQLCCTAIQLSFKVVQKLFWSGCPSPLPNVNKHAILHVWFDIKPRDYSYTTGLNKSLSYIITAHSCKHVHYR